MGLALKVWTSLAAISTGCVDFLALVQLVSLWLNVIAYHAAIGVCNKGALRT